jgi:CBS domain-containing protein
MILVAEFGRCIRFGFPYTCVLLNTPMNVPVSALLGEKASQIFSISSTSTVLDAVHEMNRLMIGSIIVLEEDRLVGIFTERDVLQRVVAKGLSPASTSVADVMTKDVETITPQTTLEQTMEAMTERRHRHLPVVDGDQIKGLVSIGDVTRWISQANEDEAHSLRSYIMGGF